MLGLDPQQLLSPELNDLTGAATRNWRWTMW